MANCSATFTSIALIFGLASSPALACPNEPADAQRPADFVPLSVVAPEIPQDILYRGSDNFLGQSVNGYAQAVCWLTRAAAEALLNAQRQLVQKGWSLKVYDCYRPQRAVAHFGRWAANPDDRTRSRYYPNLPKTALLAEGYIAACSGHSRGSTVDVGLVRLAKPKGPPKPITCGAADAELVEMGTGFDCFDSLAHTDQKTTPAARRHRDLLRDSLAQAGFRNYPKEWWHYTLVNEPYPNRYFDFLPLPSSTNAGTGAGSSGSPNRG